MDINFLKSKLNRVAEDIESTKISISELKKSIEVKEGTKEFITKVLYIKKSEMNILIEIVNRGLKFIYPEKELVFDMRFDEKSSRVVPEFYIGDNKLDNKLLKGTGGGIIEVVGLLLYITFLKIKNVKIALMDEIGKMVDSHATELLIEFLDYFSKENNMSILLITHKDIEDYNEINITSKIKMLKLMGG
mgnify:CR=1 FL=1